MARWWTKPPIVVAALGVLAVILSALLPRTTITQYTSGSGSPAVGNAGRDVTITQPPMPPPPAGQSPTPPPSQPSIPPAPPPGQPWWQQPPVIAAIIAAIATLATALIAHARAVARRDQGTATKAQIMKVFWVVVLSVWAFQAQAAVMETITQTTMGWCSPTVGHADGNVTITCQGVNPKALERLNELLDKKDFELQAKIREAEAWAQKYRELEQRLAAEGQESPLAQQVQAFLKEGKLEEAGALLDRLIEAEEKAVERVAAHHFNRAEIYALQWQPQKALPHYKKAYDYRPDNVEYAHRYAATLQIQRDFQSAEAIYQTNLATLRARSTVDPATFLPTLGRTLNNLGLLYNDTNRPLASEQAGEEALRIQRQLAKSNAPTDLAGVAAALNNLAYGQKTHAAFRP